MDAAGIIWRLRNGDPPTQDELNWFAAGLADQSVSDAQAGAFAMAVCLNGLGDAGRRDLTLAMRDSGATLSWDFDAPILDKHSTGGIGDCVSLILAPLLAAAGVVVPMISGRGLGHTGGTLDKLEAIPGLRTQFDKPHLDAILTTAGCVIAGATGDIAPADRRLYAVRDVTGTVDSLDLITASILSKKLAAGLQGLVLDVKCGSGAFMQTPSDARDLARSLVETANAAGCKTSAIISDMNAPLAPALGNALEVRVALEVLAGSAKGRLRDLSIHDLLDQGTALDHFARMIAAMGGPIGFADNWNRYLPEASVILEVHAKQSGYISGFRGIDMGNVVVDLGGGRRVENDAIDPSVGIDHVLPLRTAVGRGDVIARVHANRLDRAQEAVKALENIILIDSAAVDEPPLILEQIGL
ncbi:MAG: thymidine phosphorylase [Rhodobacteraceae bacterium]|nr:thymidine phosphorylase [Paracoccaceae bacterium]